MSEEWARKFNEGSEVVLRSLARSHVLVEGGSEFFLYEDIPGETVIPTKYVMRISGEPPDPALMARLFSDFCQLFLLPGRIVIRKWWKAESIRDHDMMADVIYVKARLGIQSGWGGKDAVDT